MKRLLRILPFFLFVLLLDRFFFLPSRMDRIWQYDSGVYVSEIIAYDNITIINNFEIQISRSQRFDSFYLLGCYFGRLYLMEKNSLQFTRYTAVEETSFIE